MRQGADSPKLIFLVGMPAAGKTYWGRKIADEYSIAFIDLDAFIASEEAAGITALFAQYGEEGFRKLEHKYLMQLISNATKDIIIACGGGTPCFNDNMRMVKEAGTVIYLQADVGYLLDNIGNSVETRPLLTGHADLNAYLQRLLQERKGFYEQAHHILSAQNISITTFDEIISSCISRH